MTILNILFVFGAMTATVAFAELPPAHDVTARINARIEVAPGDVRDLSIYYLGKIPSLAEVTSKVSVASHNAYGKSWYECFTKLTFRFGTIRASLRSDEGQEFGTIQEWVVEDYISTRVEGPNSPCGIETYSVLNRENSNTVEHTELSIGLGPNSKKAIKVRVTPWGIGPFASATYFHHDRQKFVLTEYKILDGLKSMAEADARNHDTTLELLVYQDGNASRNPKIYPFSFGP